jgi:hypothetical protein
MQPRNQLDGQESGRPTKSFARSNFRPYPASRKTQRIGTKAEAEELKAWLEDSLREDLHLALSAEKTLITHARQRVRFLGDDITRWKRSRVVRIHTKQGSITRRTGGYQLRLLMPQDKIAGFAKKYGDISNWHGKHPHDQEPQERAEALRVDAQSRRKTGKRVRIARIHPATQERSAHPSASRPSASDDEIQKSNRTGQTPMRQSMRMVWHQRGKDGGASCAQTREPHRESPLGTSDDATPTQNNGALRRVP